MFLNQTATRTRWLAIFLVVATFSATFSRSAWAADDVLKLLPEKTLGFALVNRLSEVNEKLGKHVRELELPLPDLLGLIQNKIGIERGLDLQGTLVVAAVSSVDGSQRIEDSEVLMILPVSDYQQFVEQSGGHASSEISELMVAGQPMLVAKKMGYALMVLSDSEHRTLLQGLLTRETTAPAEIAEIAAWLAGNDAAGVVLSPGIQMLAEKGIAELEKVKKNFAGMKAALGDQADQVAASLDMYLQLMHMLKAEVHTAADGLRIDDAGNIRFGGRVRFAEDGRLAMIKENSNSNVEELLASLPGGLFAGVMSASMSPECGELMAQWSVAMMKNNPALYGMKLTEDEADKYYELMVSSMKDFRGLSMMMGPGEEGDTLLDSTLGIFSTEDSVAYLATYKELMEQFQQFMDKSDSTFPYDMKLSNAQIAGQKGFKFEMDMSAALTAQKSPPQAIEMMEKIFGDGGKLTGHILALDKTNVLFSYGSEKTIERMLTALQSGEPGLDQAASIKKIKPLLPKDAGLVAYLSPCGLVAWVKNIATTLMPPGMLGEIPQFPETAAIGFAVKMVPGGLETELVVPAELPKVVKEYVERVKQ